MLLAHVSLILRVNKGLHPSKSADVQHLPGQEVSSQRFLLLCREVLRLFLQHVQLQCTALRHACLKRRQELIFAASHTCAVRFCACCCSARICATRAASPGPPAGLARPIAGLPNCCCCCCCCCSICAMRAVKRGSRGMPTPQWSARDQSKAERGQIPDSVAAAHEPQPLQLSHMRARKAHLAALLQKET